MEKLDMTIRKSNIMLKLHPLYQKILVKMYKFGMDDDYNYNSEKGKMWLSRLSRLLNANPSDISNALDVLNDTNIVGFTRNIMEKITDTDDNKVKYVRCFIINDDYLDDVKEWIKESAKRELAGGYNRPSK